MRDREEQGILDRKVLTEQQPIRDMPVQLDIQDLLDILVVPVQGILDHKELTEPLREEDIVVQLDL